MDGAGNLQIAFWAAFEENNLVGNKHTKQDSLNDAYAKCKGGGYEKPGNEKCGISETLKYLCLTDTDATGAGQGYDLNNDPTWNPTEIRSDPRRKKLKELLERCDKIHYPGLMFRDLLQIPSRWLNVISDAGYNNVVLIPQNEQYLHKKQGNYCTEDVLLETMDDRYKHLYLHMKPYFCKAPAILQLVC